ncbi:MAG: hypothetical protein ABFS22_05895 [Pseudomonadota bacterium]
MRHLPIYTAVPLLATLLLPGCEAPETPTRTEPAPVARETISPEATHAPAPEPKPEPKPKPKQDDAQPAIEQRAAKSLKLTIDNTPDTGQPAVTFGDVPEPDWLDKDQAAGGMDEASVSDNLLPELFDTPTDSKAVSVKGKILTDSGSDGTSTKIDGAGVNIQIHSD